MIVDTSAASAFVEFICLSIYGYIDSFLKTLGIRRVPALGNEYACDNIDFRNKRTHIQNCLGTLGSVDLWELRELALSEGGLLQGVFCSPNFEPCRDGSLTRVPLETREIDLSLDWTNNHFMKILPSHETLTFSHSNASSAENERLTFNPWNAAQYRQKAWPKLVGLSEEDIIPELVLSTTDSESPMSMRSLNEINTDYGAIIEEEKKSEIEANIDLIRRDAGRSVIFRYNNEIPGAAPITPPFASERLAQVLENTIRQGNASLHYYQGLHDIAGVLLHNMDYQVDATTQILKRISQSHLRDAMRENFSNINWFLSVLLPPLVEKVDPYVHYALQVAEVELATICLPWMITWFTHDIHDPETAGRLVDAFLSGHPLLPIYFAVALITHPVLKKELIHADCEDPSMVFMAIKRMPLKLKTTDKETFSFSRDQQKHQYISLQEVLEDCISIM